MQHHLTINQSMSHRLGKANSLEPRATKLFERALRASRSWFRRTPSALPRLDDQTHTITQQHHLGAQTVAVQAITGTLNKSAGFDAEFHPTGRGTENRWLRVATAMLRGDQLPPIELIKVGEDYYVVDGHHRISVARMLGFGYLDAVVTVWEIA